MTVQYGDSRSESSALSFFEEHSVTVAETAEDEPTMLVCDIFGHVYFKETRKGEWTAEKNAEVQELMDRAERLAHVDETALAVLKLLLSLADSAPATSYTQVVISINQL